MSQKMMIAITAFCLFLVSANAAEKKTDLSRYSWKNRVLLLKGSSKDTLLKNSLERLKASEGELKERDVIILREEASKFKAELYGKDGKKKWETRKAFKVSELTELIDSMPMRQAEKKQ